VAREKPQETIKVDGIFARSSISKGGKAGAKKKDRGHVRSHAKAKRTQESVSSTDKPWTPVRETSRKKGGGGALSSTPGNDRMEVKTWNTTHWEKMRDVHAASLKKTKQQRKRKIAGRASTMVLEEKTI